ncbi:MAG: DNA polymerase/3'-5' exonuclease PolX [Actinobacteria bacterium]|nr:DNA polymerase/3'-5' exonuclease PolX [Actinomycetota bacterium]
MISNKIAKIFEDLADMLEIKGDNPFRIRAYRKVARNIRTLTDEFEKFADEGRLDQIPGIGEGMKEKIYEILDTGRLQFYEDLKSEIPPSLVKLLSVPGIGPKLAKKFYDELNIRDIEQLEKMAKEHHLAGLPGIKEKTEQNILKGIEMLKKGLERMNLGIALPIANEIVNQLSKLPEVKRISTAGSIRRRKETIGDIDILTTSSNSKKVMNTFINLPQVERVLVSGETKSSIVTFDGIHVDLRVVKPESYGAALAYFTGSKAHNIRIREIAMKNGLKINEYGVFDEKNNKKIAGENEEEIYQILDLPFIVPELREDRGEIEVAKNNNLPDLVKLSEINGDLHVHTVWSDGGNSIEEMIKDTQKRGYKYLAICDHSQSLKIAGGLSEEKLVEQIEKIKELNKKYKNFTILAGSEVDIKADGSLDYPDELLKKLDIVVAAIHTRFRRSRYEMTKRIIKAIQNPHVNILAHPTGRLLGVRDAYEVDLDEILKVAKINKIALEINAFPERLDLNDINCRKAKEYGVMISINTDSHITNQLDYMALGVSVARRGWLEPENIINTKPIEQIIKFLKS